jgi:hypothetical protein
MEEFDLAVRSIAPLTDYLYYHVMGEPLLHPLLPTFIRRATELGLKSAVTTNGTLLPDRGRELIESGVYKVNVSVHSFEDGSDEEYADYLNGCLDFADEASRSGVLTVLRLWNKGVSDTKNSETESAIFARFGEPESISARGARIRDKLHLEYGDRFVWPDCEADELGDRVYCHGLHDHFGVLSDGSVIGNVAFSKDVTATAHCLSALGASLNVNGNLLNIGGLNIFNPQENVILDCKESGSTLRFLIPLCLVSGKKTTFKGAKRLFERPL